MRLYLADFKFIPLPENDAARAGLFRLLDRHRLRSADAGHLQALKLAKKLSGKLEFVCFDEELVRAAEREGVRVFGQS